MHPSGRGNPARRRVAALVAGLMLAAAAPAASAPQSPAQSPAWTSLLGDADSAARVADVLDPVDGLRATMGQGGFVERAAAAFAADGSPVPAVPALPAASTADVALAANGSVPVAVQAPIAGLWASVRTALELMGGPVPAGEEPANGEAALDISALMAMLELPEIQVPLATPTSPFASARSVHAPDLPASLERTRDANRPAVLLIAAALDAYLPILEAAAGTGSVPVAVGTGSAPVAAESGCDLLDAVPLLCVGSDGDNTYTADAVLHIDLGGDDTYRSRAGGAPFVDPGNGLDYPLSVVVDVAGNDHYEPDQLAGEPILVGIGAGGTNAFGGGVGILVDAAGDDRYHVTVPPAPDGINHDASPFSFSASHGAGVNGGVGMLFDLGGADVYRVAPPRGQPLGAGFVSVAQGAGVAGAGLLVDVGAGDDVYEIAGHVTTSRDAALQFPLPHAIADMIGQGFGGPGGVGLLVDDGGADRFSVAGRATSVSNGAGPADFGDFTASTRFQGQGNGFAGVGMLLHGAGDATYDVDVSTVGLGGAVAGAQGVGTLGGVGVLSDAAGDTAYRVATSVRHDRTIDVRDSCGGGGRDCSTVPSVLATVHNDGLTSVISAQGMGLDGIGLLHDTLGDDSYDLANDQGAQVTLTDRRAAPAAPAALRVQGFNVGGTAGQGAAYQGGVGLLLDEAGADRYAVTSLNETVAHGGTDNGLVPRVTAANNGVAGLEAQGATGLFGALGALVDVGGAADTFTVAASAPVTTSPDPDGAFQLGYVRPAVQAAGVNGVFTALGEGSRVGSSPSAAACSPTAALGLAPASRGYGAWANCPLYAVSPDPGQQAPDYQIGNAAGLVPLPPDDPHGALAFTGDTPSEVPGDRHGDFTPAARRLPVGVGVTDESGQPVAGALVHFALQFGCPGDICQPAELADHAASAPILWRAAFDVQARTDADGVARARLPLVATGLAMELTPALRFRVLATFDGEPGSLRPGHAAHPLTILGGS